MLDPEVPLHGIGVLRIGVHVPEDLVERCRRGEEPLGKGIRTGFVRQHRLAQLVVDVVVELLRDVGPAPFIVLGCLGDARPVVEKHAEGGAQRCFVLQPVGEADARLPVVRGVVVDLAARLRQYMPRKAAVGSRNARRPLAHGARRRDLLDEIDATLQVIGAGLDPAVFAFTWWMLAMLGCSVLASPPPKKLATLMAGNRIPPVNWKLREKVSANPICLSKSEGMSRKRVNSSILTCTRPYWT